MEIALHILVVLMLVYAAICLIYFFFQESFIFVPSFIPDHFRTKVSTPIEEFKLDTPHQGKIHSITCTVIRVV